MTRTFKLLTLGALSGWLLTTTGCEDKVCLGQLQTCKKESTEQQKVCASNVTKLQEAKTQLAEAQAKVDSLSKENDELKAKSEEAAAKTKATKGKHKKKRSKK